MAGKLKRHPAVRAGTLFHLAFKTLYHLALVASSLLLQHATTIGDSQLCRLYFDDIVEEETTMCLLDGGNPRSPGSPPVSIVEKYQKLLKIP